MLLARLARARPQLARTPLAAAWRQLSSDAPPAIDGAQASPVAVVAAHEPLAGLEGMRRTLKLPVGTLTFTKLPGKRGTPPVRLEGFPLPAQRGALHGLTTIFGVGIFQAHRLCSKAFLAWDLRVAELTNIDIERLSNALKEMSSEEANKDAPSHMRFEYGDRLKRRIGGNIRALQVAGLYRGKRHTAGLPVRGQRTKTNAKSARRAAANRKYGV
ncbi:hypothetical protein T492DRAFT_1015871 [Pavlovales sp. CCMP2436]|nr:hypothetical protein T492DRAFT_1015871 [Pavlovales sp. CCMP2436]